MNTMKKENIYEKVMIKEKEKEKVKGINMLKEKGNT